MKILSKIKQAVFKFSPFSIKQKKVLTWWLPNSPVKDKDGIIADGSIRSGKTLSMSLSFVIWAMETFDSQNFGMCGKTIGSFRRNVLFWLKLMLRSRKYKVKDLRADNLLIVSKNDKINYFYIFGGKDERSQDLIQGITLAGCFFDEVALMPESFVNQATGRCSVEGSKYWFNCNPEGPYHWFKVNWIDKRKKKNLLYLHFTMDDNLSLSEAVKERYRKMYSGVFFKRYILGLWVMAEGIIFDMFSEEKHVKEVKDSWDYLFVSCDYGTQNPCTFGLFGVKGKRLHEIRSYYYDGRKESRQKTDSEYAEDMVDFIGIDKRYVRFIIVDPSAASFIAELKKSKYKLPKIKKAENDVLDGIRTVAVYLETSSFSLDPSCEMDIREFFSYIWDEKAMERGEDKPIKQNDHAMDKIRYAIYTVFGSANKTSAKVKIKPRGL